MTVEWENKFRGTHKEIGMQLGEYWGEYYSEKELKDWLNYGSKLAQKCAGGGFEQLLKNINKGCFREILEEVNGMAAGVGKYFATTPEAILALTLGETEEMCCSSVVRKTTSGYLLGHNEEENPPEPLCFARVRLKTKNGNTIRFASVSYPFQLFGSACGMTPTFAFQGNSIGTGENEITSWNKRIPKTFFSRKMLELASIDEVTDMFKKHPTTLPNHHYIVFHDGAYSLEIAPILGTNDVRCYKIEDEFDVHTNHFLDSRELDSKWRWMSKEDQRDSHERLCELRRMWRVHTGDGLIKRMVKFRNNGREKYTSATVVFELTEKGTTCSGRYYPPGLEKEAPTQKVTTIELKRNNQHNKVRR